MGINVTHSKKQFSAFILSGTFLFEYPCDSTTSCSPYTAILDPGKYRLEVWGASGGDRGDGKGGSGGYSTGILSLHSKTTLYVTVGGHGSIVTSGNLEGGYNGGGSSRYAEDSDYGTGGGATDIRIDSNDDMSRVIVAGGGGGYGKYKNSINNGGFGGGVVGGGTNGGGQEYEIQQCAETYCWCGGGGGWSNGNWGNGYGKSGGGGSGFTFNANSKTPSSFKLDQKYYLSYSKTLDMETGFKSPFSFWEYGHRGNGFAKISIIEKITCHYQLKTSILSLSYLLIFLLKT